MTQHTHTITATTLYLEIHNFNNLHKLLLMEQFSTEHPHPHTFEMYLKDVLH